MKIGIIGLGLMGGSFSYDIRDLYPDAVISGFDISKENTITAIELGIISSLLDIKKISDFNIIIVSVPVDKSIDVLKRVLNYVFTFKKYFLLNILFSVFYALFSAVAFLSLMPMLEVLFNGVNDIKEKPQLELSNNLGEYIENWLNFQVSSFAADDNQKAILFVVGVVIILFFLKNISNYLMKNVLQNIL